MSVRIEVLGSVNCPHLADTARTVTEIAHSLVPEAVVETRLVANEAEARALSLPGSPTVRVNGRDIAAQAAGCAPSLACRSYEGQAVPSEWLIEAAIVRALRPRHLLFLCVANSARSQMAEGIARASAPAGVQVSSAGSAPSKVRPQAIQVLKEIGIDISAHTSKAVSAIDSKSVEAVFTLCSEEECPLFLGKALRLHWGLPDPAGVKGSEEEQLNAFRAARDELRRRIDVLFADWQSTQT